ncbi:MAG: periplasmic heavy metal sensor [Desulfobulbaceae bacterium]|nr:periplasmic heavy metal sensor [Desulfobulbaceae bacterium]
MKKIIAAIAVTLTVATASIGLANGPWGGPMMHDQVNQNFSVDQQKQIEQIEQKYQQQLTEKEEAVRGRSIELDKALAKDSTTIAEANQLRSELYTLEQEYWQLRTAIDQEVGKTIGTTYRGTYGWGPGYCSWHDDHSGMYGREHNYNKMRRGNNTSYMAYGPGNCRW